MLITMVTLLVSTMYYNHFTEPIYFLNAPKNVFITRSMDFTVLTRNMEEGKVGNSTMAYNLSTKNKGKNGRDIDIFSKLLVYSFICNIQPAPDTIPHFTYSGVEKFIILSFFDDVNSVMVSSNPDGTISVSWKRKDGADMEKLCGYIDSDKLTNLINHFIARAEKLYPERYL